ncbi:MAG: D-alanine--D-alanine ligase [Gammaproteobacteria bacterium]|nr:D-alanine--D-alanine ligase [Gammaproteobacteria bacterium]
MVNRNISAADFGKVALLMGGTSAEREISLDGGQAVYTALQRQGVDVTAIDVRGEVVCQLRQAGYDRVFNLLHGRGGEDGVMQGALKQAGIPCTGSGVTASAIAMSKLQTKRIWQAAAIPTPAYRCVTRAADLTNALGDLGLPLIIKPAHEGSSLGMSRVDSAADLLAAWQQAAAFDPEVLLEQWVSGREYTIAILGRQVLPVIHLETHHSFYDFDAKYRANDTRYRIPCGLESSAEEQLQQLALSAFDAVGAEGWGRVDVMADSAGNFWPIEINTVPGMTSHSLVPMAAAAAGISFDALVWQILATTLAPVVTTESAHAGD